jgi:selenocysteine lyase/cysteine desulfurase
MNIKSYFPITKDITYLDTAARGLLSKQVYETKQEDIDFLYKQTYGYQDEEDLIVKDTKQHLSKIFNVHPFNIGISQNFSVAFNFVLDGLDKNNSVLMLDGDYPSVVLPIKSRKFKYSTLAISHDVEDRIYSFIQQNRPNVFALSLTQFLNGLHIRPSFLAKLKQDFPELLILADATQYLGVEPFDFEKSKIDLLISSTYKWLNAGFGSAVLFMSEVLKTKLSSHVIGANSLIDKTKSDSKPMGFLEPGHYDLNSIKSLKAALNLHYDIIGITSVYSKIQKLSQMAFEAFCSEHLLEETVVQRKFHSSIFNLNIHQDKFHFFEDENIYLSIRGKGLRLSLHYYNTQEDLERFMDVFRKIP